MALGNACPLIVGLLLVLLVVTVIGVDDIFEFADFVLEMIEAFFCFVEVGI